MATIALLGSSAAWAGTGFDYKEDSRILELLTSSTDPDNLVITAEDIAGFGTNPEYIFIDRQGSTAKYSTVMVPATVTAGQDNIIEAAYVPTSYDVGQHTMSFTAVEQMNANTPYLVEIKDGGVGYSFEFHNEDGFTIEPTGDTEHSTILAKSCWEFIGTYKTKDWLSSPGNVYGYDAADGQFVRAGNNATIYPMRAYLTCNNGLGKSTTDEDLPEVIKVRLLSKSGETLSIGKMNTRTGDIQMQDRYYDLKGRKLNGKPQNKMMYVNKKVIKH